MSTHPCDQLATDAASIRSEIEKETGVIVNFDLQQVEEMVDLIEILQRSTSMDSYELTESVMGKYNFLNDVEYSAHKRLLDKIFKRRLGARSSMHARNGKFAPFAPLEAYHDL